MGDFRKKNIVKAKLTLTDLVKPKKGGSGICTLTLSNLVTEMIF